MVDTETTKDSEREARSGRIFQVGLENARIGNLRATIRNVSQHGLGGRCGIPLEPGERLIVSIESAGRIGASVRWCDGQRFGLKLDKAIDPARLMFANKPWDAAAAAALRPSDATATPFRPVTSTWRPGFRSR